MPGSTDHSRARPITALISNFGSSVVNLPEFNISAMLKGLLKLPQQDIVAHLAENEGLALVTSASGHQGHYRILHNFVVETAASTDAEGNPVPPTVYCGIGTESPVVMEELRLAWSSTGRTWRYPALKKSSAQLNIPTMNVILGLDSEALDGAELDDADFLAEGTVSFDPTFFTVLNGRALKAVENRPNPSSFGSLLLALTDLSRSDLESKYMETSLGTDPPSLEDLLEWREVEKIPFPYELQIKQAHAWLVGSCAGPEQNDIVGSRTVLNPSPSLRDRREALQREVDALAGSPPAASQLDTKDSKPAAARVETPTKDRKPAREGIGNPPRGKPNAPR